MSTIASNLAENCQYYGPNGTITELAVTVIRIPKDSVKSVFTLAENSIVARLEDGNTATALGLIFRVNLGQGMTPAILSGMRMDGGLVLPPGCAARLLKNYSGAVSDLKGGSEIVLSIAFDAKVHGHIASLTFTGYPDLQIA